jgi:molybdate transport system substrate-binding protein
VKRASSARNVTVLALVALVVGACSADGRAGGGADSPDREIVVFGAASLTESFGELADTFESANEGARVSLSFGPSDGLATQIIEGAPADVFASASGTWMDAVQDDGPGVQIRTDFVRNRLAVITPTDDPAGIDGIEDLGKPGVKLVLAAEDVPAGTYAHEALANAGVAGQAEANLVSNEEDVKAVVQKVLLGEADAGIVYVTDLTSEVENEIRVIEIPDDVNVIATYPIGVVADSNQPGLAHAFVDLVTGSEGQGILRAYGFMSPA